MKKILSALFSIFVIAAIVVAVYFNQQFVLHQIDKIKGMYYVHLGDRAYSVLNTKNAILYYNKGLNLYPKHYGAWYNLGNIYVAYEDYYSALNAYSNAFKYNPKMMIARINYGIVASEKLGDFDSAIKQYDKVIKTKRKLVSIPHVYNNKTSYKENKAIAYYNKGVTYRLKALYTTDDYELQRRYLSNAIKAYEKSIEINPNSYDTQYNLATSYHRIGDYDRAGMCYCKAIQLAPMNFEAHYNLAVLLRKIGHTKEAYEEIDKAMTLITALDTNSSVQEYVAIVLNNITRDLKGGNENRQKLSSILAKGKNKGLYGETLTSEGINFVNGKIVATEELDKSILKNFGQCPSSVYFERVEDEI